jgi:hypothetical protein
MYENEIIFNRETLDKNFFKIENVENDNACFYRALSNCIKFNSINDINLLYSNDFIEQTNLSKELQHMIFSWISYNKNKKIKYTDNLELDIETLIELIHDISYNEYLFLYKHFAGNFNGLPNRWGSFCEQSVLSHILKIPIIVLSLNKYDNKYDKVISGRITENLLPYHNTRFKIIQISGNEYIKQKKPIFLLWRKKNKKNLEHYLSLYPNKNYESEIMDKLNI